MASSYTLGSTYLISANTVQAFRLAVNRNASHYFNLPQGKLFNWCDTGVKLYCDPAVTRVEGLSITGGFSISAGADNWPTGFSYVGTNYSLNDDLSLVRGRHQLAFGASISQGRNNQLAVYASIHQFTF